MNEPTEPSVGSVTLEADDSSSPTQIANTGKM